MSNDYGDWIRLAPVTTGSAFPTSPTLSALTWSAQVFWPAEERSMNLSVPLKFFLFAILARLVCNPVHWFSALGKVHRKIDIGFRQSFSKDWALHHWLSSICWACERTIGIWAVWRLTVNIDGPSPFMLSISYIRRPLRIIWIFKLSRDCPSQFSGSHATKVQGRHV